MDDQIKQNLFNSLALTDAQRAIVEDNSSRVVALGGRRSGKTRALITKAIVNAMDGFNTYIITGSIRSNINIINEVEKVLDIAWLPIMSTAVEREDRVIKINGCYIYTRTGSTSVPRGIKHRTYFDEFANDSRYSDMIEELRHEVQPSLFVGTLNDTGNSNLVKYMTANAILGRSNSSFHNLGNADNSLAPVIPDEVVKIVGKIKERGKND